MPDKDPVKGQESVQLFQEHAARSTQSLPFRMAPGTLYALGVFFLLAMVGLSIRVGNIRGELEQQRVQNQELESELPAEAIDHMFSPDDEGEDAQQDVPTEEEMADLKQQWKDQQARDLHERAPRLVAMLRSGELDKRTEASLLLRESEAGFTYLVEALSSEDAQVRRAAANAISLSENAPADLVGPPLLEALRSDPDPYVREYAATGVGRFMAPGTVDALMEASSDENPDIRQAALAGLMYIDDMITFPAFARALEEDDKIINRYVAATGITLLAYERRRDPVPEEWADVISRAAGEMIKSLDERIRARGCQVAGYFRLKSFTSRLVNTLGDPANLDETTGAGGGADPSWEARARAAEALGYLYEGQAADRSDALAHLVNALVVAESFDPEPAVRWKASEALTRTGYDPNDWGKLEMLQTSPDEVLEGREAAEFHGL